MSFKLFVQIILLMIIGVLVVTLMKCAMMQCPVMGKYIKSCQIQTSMPATR